MRATRLKTRPVMMPSTSQPVRGRRVAPGADFWTRRETPRSKIAGMRGVPHEVAVVVSARDGVTWWSDVAAEARPRSEEHVHEQVSALTEIGQVSGRAHADLVSERRNERFPKTLQRGHVGRFIGRCNADLRRPPEV